MLDEPLSLTLVVVAIASVAGVVVAALTTSQDGRANWAVRVYLVLLGSVPLRSKAPRSHSRREQFFAAFFLAFFVALVLGLILSKHAV